MSVTVLGVGELDVVTDDDAVIKTYALGSCIAVITMDPATHAVGMLHMALPDSTTNPDRARTHPGYFADTGIAMLLDRMVEAGTTPGDPGLIVKLAGGARVLDVGDRFDVGQKNAHAAREFLGSKGLRSRSEDLGGSISRTVEVSVASGRTQISTTRRTPWEI